MSKSDVVIKIMLAASEGYREMGDLLEKLDHSRPISPDEADELAWAIIHNGGYTENKLSSLLRDLEEEEE